MWKIIFSTFANDFGLLSPTRSGNVLILMHGSIIVFILLSNEIVSNQDKEVWQL